MVKDHAHGGRTSQLFWRDEKIITVSLWMEKNYLERYEREWFPKVEEILKPYLKTPITFKVYTVETSLCEHFVHALAA